MKRLALLSILCFATAAQLLAQNITVKGTVVDASSGEGIPSVPAK